MGQSFLNCRSRSGIAILVTELGLSSYKGLEVSTIKVGAGESAGSVSRLAVHPVNESLSVEVIPGLSSIDAREFSGSNFRNIEFIKTYIGSHT